MTVALTVMVCSCARQPESATAQAQGVDMATVALWLFDEPVGVPTRFQLEDQTTQGYDLTLGPGGAIVNGASGNALDPHAGEHYAAIRRHVDDTELGLGDGDWTLELRLKMLAPPAGGEVLYQLQEDLEVGQYPTLTGKGRVLGFSTGPGGETILFTGPLTGARSLALKTNADVMSGRAGGWHHVAFGYQAGSNTLRHWVDGTLVDSKTLPGDLAPLARTGRNNLSIGRDISGGHALPGLIDEMRLSSKLRYSDNFAPPSSLRPGKGVVRLGKGPHLFLDDYLVDNSRELTLTLHRPERMAGVGRLSNCSAVVIPDAQTGAFRSLLGTSVSESRDGLTFGEPVQMTGLSEGPHPVMYYASSVTDEGPAATDPARRFKILYFPETWNKQQVLQKGYCDGVCAAFSPDCIHWTQYAGNPVALYLRAGSPGSEVTMSDINDVFYDPATGLYVHTYKTYSLPGENPELANYRDDRWNYQNIEVSGFRRLVGLATSRDYVHWREPQRIVVPDDGDEGETQFYGMTVITRGDLRIGNLRVLRDDVGDGIGWTQLAFSRDLYHWTRFREPFFDRTQDPGAWDHDFGICWLFSTIVTGDKMLLYYRAKPGHKVTEGAGAGVATLRVDGWVSRDAGPTRGFLRTPLVTLNAGKMTVNAKVEGELRVRILNEAGKPVPGFDWKDCSTIRGDAVSHPVRWRGRLASLQGKPVALEFALRRAQLYGFELHGEA
jgi:hypothetical protein